MNRFQARDALATEIAKRTGTTPKPQADMKVITFGWFVRNRWLPLKEANWKEETARDKKCIIERDLLAKFESVPLEHFDKFTLQVHLNDLAKTRSRDRVLQIRAYARYFRRSSGSGFPSQRPSAEGGSAQAASGH